MDTRQDTHRQPTAAHATLLANLPNSPTTPLPPTLFLSQSHLPLSEASPPFSVDIPPGHRLQDHPAPLLTFSRPWEPTPENITRLLQCEGVWFGNENGRLGDDKDDSNDDFQHASSSSSSSSAVNSSLSLSSAASPSQGEEGQSFLKAVSGAAAVAVTLHTTSDRPLSNSQLSASAKPTTAARKNKRSSPTIKLVQQIPPQSRTYFKSVPSFQRQSYASSGSNDLSSCNSSSGGSPSLKATVDPFDSDRDVLSKVYILTTSPHDPNCLAALSAKQQLPQNQLPPKYLLKVFPDMMPFKHRATRTDPGSKPDSARAVMKKIIEDTIQHELGAIKWAQKYLRETNTPKILSYSSPGDRSTESSEGVEKYGVLGFILTEFPAKGIIYHGPLEEFKAKTYQQIEMSERLAKILYEMRSSSYSMRVSGFSIHLTSKADDGSPITIDKVSSPYNRFDMIVHELHRKDAEDAVKRISCPLLDTASQTSPSTSSPSIESRPEESSQVEIIRNGITNELLEDSEGTSTVSTTIIGDVYSSNLTTISENSSSFSSSSLSAAAPTLIYLPTLTPVKAPRRMSLQMRMHKKNIERKMSASNEMLEFPPMPMPQPTTEAADTFTLATIADTIETEDQTDVDFLQDAEELASRRQPDSWREENPQDNLIQTIAKRLINASPLPRDALEACRRISQSGHQQRDQDEDQSQSFDACASFENLQILAAGTLHRIMDTKKARDTKKPSKAFMSIRPSSIVSVAASIRSAPYIIPSLEAIPSRMWPNCSPTSSTSSSFPSLPDARSGSCSLSRSHFRSSLRSNSGSRSGSESKKVNRRSAIRRTSCSFDTDPSIYCSTRAQAKYSDGRGEVCRITIDVSVDPSPSSSPSSSSAHLATTKSITWPKEFIMPNNYENGKPMYTSVAEHEYARMVNALVALERLDSTPGSKNRFPKELLDLLPRILRFTDERDILFGPKPSPGSSSSSNGSSSSSPSRKGNEGGVGRDKLPPVKIASLADMAAVYNPPALFDGIEAVFTHGQLAVQGSLVTNRQKHGIVSVSNFQKAGFLPPYEEDVKGLFVEKVSCSFWNVPSSSGGEDGSEGERDGGGQDKETEDRKRKTTSNTWPFKRCSKLPTTNASTTTLPAALHLESLTEVDEEAGPCDGVGQEGATFAMPTGSISIHGKYPVPYPLLNHAIENGLSCGNRYMVLVDVSPPILSTPTSASLTFSQSTDSLGADSVSAQGLNGSKQSSVGSNIPTTFSAATASVAGPSGDAAVVEKSGSFNRKTSQLKAKLKFKTKKTKNKTAHEDDNELDPGCLTIEELIDHPTVYDSAFPMTPIISATTTTANAPGPECFLSASSPLTSAALLLRPPPPPPRMPLVIQLPTFHKSSSSLSLSLSLPKSATSANTSASQGALLPEDPKVCQRGWAHFMKTIFAFETNAIKASTEAAAAAAEASSHVNLGLGLGSRSRTEGGDGSGFNNNNNNNNNSYSIQEVWPTQKSSFSTIKFKDSTYFHVRQQRSLTDAIFGRSDSIQVLESLVCISKTLQNAVVVLEIGGTVVTPDIFLGTISRRQQEWQRGEDARLEEIEMEKEKLRIARVEAAERQEREQEERRIALKLLREQLEEQLGGHQKGKKQMKQQKEGLQKGKQRSFHDDNIREIPPEVPPKDYYSAVYQKDSELSSRAETDTGAGVGSAQNAFSQSRSRRSGNKLKTPSFFTQLTSAILDNTTTTTTTNATTTTLKESRFVNPFKSAPQSSSLATSPSTSQSYSASTAHADNNCRQTPAYLIRTPDDDILYSAPGLQRDPLPSELPDHILFHCPPTTTGTRCNPFDLTMVHEIDLPHRLGTMIAPALPSYGIRLTNLSGTKTLAQEESERIEREMYNFWKELEALCEPPEDRRVSPSAPPGIALLSIAELERHIEVVERYVEEMRDWRARFLFHQK